MRDDAVCIHQSNVNIRRLGLNVARAALNSPIPCNSPFEAVVQEPELDHWHVAFLAKQTYQDQPTDHTKCRSQRWCGTKTVVSVLAISNGQAVGRQGFAGHTCYCPNIHHTSWYDPHFLQRPPYCAFPQRCLDFQYMTFELWHLL